MNFFRSLTLPHFKKIRVNLLGGNFRFYTQPGLNVEIIPRKTQGHEETPVIIDRTDHIEITGQNPKAFMAHREKIDVDILLPEKADLTIDALAGRYHLAGLYSAVNAKVKFGQFIWDVQTDYLNDGNVKMWFGSTLILPKPNDHITLHKDGFRKKLFSINDSDFKCEMIMGNIEIGAPISKRNNRSNL
jgi:hypothetical protein